MMATVTVPGGAPGTAITYTISSGAGLTVAQQIANALGAALTAGNLSQTTISSASGTVPIPPPPSGGLSDVVATVTGATTVTGTGVFTNNGTTSSTITATAGVQLLTGTGGGTFFATGAGAIVGAAGGNNTITASAANDTIGGGPGTNLLIATGANDSVVSGGSGDTVSAGSTGANGDTVNISGSTGDQVFGGPGSMVVGGPGTNETVSAGTGAATIFGGTSGVYFFNNSTAPTFVDEGGANTVVGGSSQVTLFGASGGVITFNTQGNNPGGAILSSAGIGNETLNAAGSAGPITAWGGTTGKEVFIGGSGNDTMIAGGGSTTMTGGAGSNLFAQVMQHATGGTLTVTDFTSSDSFGLYGYGTTAEQSAVSAATGSSITLGDGTTITFTNIKVSNISSQIRIG